MLSRDGWAGVALALFGLLVAILTLRTENLMAEYGPGPGFLPLVLSCMIIVLSLVLVKKGRKEALASRGKEKESDDRIFHRPLVVLGSVAVILLAAFLFEKVGFVIVIWAITSFFVKISRPEYALYKCLLTGLITGVVFYALFKYGLGLNLPKGVIPL